MYVINHKIYYHYLFKKIIYLIIHYNKYVKYLILLVKVIYYKEKYINSNIMN